LINDTDELNYYWRIYVENGLVSKRLDTSYFSIPDSERYNYICLTGNYKEDQVTLKNVMTKAGKRKLTNRFKAWKYKKSSNKVSLTIDSSTLDKLKIVQREAGLNKDKYDLMFEFWFSGDYDDKQLLENAMKSVLELPPSLSKESLLMLLLHKMPAAKQEILFNVLESAFAKGWEARQRSKRDRLKDSALDSYREQLHSVRRQLFGANR
tara:strand:- start:584 stop:1210 length:627 start_codon:yes stop_codon:yes gene_type:complete